MHQVHGKVSRASLNAYPMWLFPTYTRPRERYGCICQYKKVDPMFSNYLFCFSEFGDLIFFVFVPELYGRFKMYLWYVKSGVHVRVSRVKFAAPT
jgi:hypothetical protein